MNDWDKTLSPWLKKIQLAPVIKTDSVHFGYRKTVPVRVQIIVQENSPKTKHDILIFILELRKTHIAQQFIDLYPWHLGLPIKMISATVLFKRSRHSSSAIIDWQ